ncbi:MAG TPA: beta-propeller fold lactonase family protein [Streptosporangiaceae bacterium]|nr:beta-propeller fold lactonase family protein [Streptosporangiaceae bacterium]
MAAASGLLGLGVAASVVAAGGAGAVTTAGKPVSGHCGPWRVCGYLYVNDNTARANTVAGFARRRNGSLSPLPGSPFRAGGAGTGAAIGSQGALQETDNGRYLIAVDAGSDQISVMRVRPGGGLTLVGRPVYSGGSEPVSLAVHRNLVYVANAGTRTNFTGFTINRAGMLRRLARSTVTLPAGSLPGDVLFNGNGRILAGTLVDSSQIVTFTVGFGGRLTAAPTSPLAAQATGPFGSEFRPTNPRQLFVSNAHAGANLGSVSAFRAAANGNLTPIGASPFADLQTAPCWVEISHDGRYLFTVNTAVPSISRYAITRGGSLNLLGSTVFNYPTGLGPQDARLSPDGRMLYVVGTGARKVSGFAVRGGMLTELASSPTSLPANSAPFGLVVT